MVSICRIHEGRGHVIVSDAGLANVSSATRIIPSGSAPDMERDSEQDDSSVIGSDRIVVRTKPETLMLIG